MHCMGCFRFIESIHQIHIMQLLRNIAARMSGLGNKITFLEMAIRFTIFDTTAIQLRGFLKTTPDPPPIMPGFWFPQGTLMGFPVSSTKHVSNDLIENDYVFITPLGICRPYFWDVELLNPLKWKLAWQRWTCHGMPNKTWTQVLS